jgi:DNA-binding transcriptional regulator YdaS (Cro superfamily)
MGGLAEPTIGWFTTGMRPSHPSLDAFFTDYGCSTSQVAESLGVTNEAVRAWRRGIRRIPTSQARLIEDRFGIPKHLLRPDVWDPPRPAEARAQPETTSGG